MFGGTSTGTGTPATFSAAKLKPGERVRLPPLNVSWAIASITLPWTRPFSRLAACTSAVVLASTPPSLGPPRAVVLPLPRATTLPTENEPMLLVSVFPSVPSQPMVTSAARPIRFWRSLPIAASAGVGRVGLAATTLAGWVRSNSLRACATTI